MQRIEDDRGVQLPNLLGECRWYEFHADNGIVLRPQCLEDRGARAARHLRLGGGTSHNDNDRTLPRARRPIFQLFDQCLTDLQDVARPHRNDKIPRAHMLCKVAFKVSAFRQIDCILPCLFCDLLH